MQKARLVIAAIGLTCAATLFPSIIWMIWGGDELAFKVLMTAAIGLFVCFAADSMIKQAMT